MRVLPYGEAGAYVDLEVAEAPERAARAHALAATLKETFPAADVATGVGVVAVFGASASAVGAALTGAVVDVYTSLGAHAGPAAHAPSAAGSAADVRASREVSEGLDVYTSSELAGPVNVYTSPEVPGAADVYTSPEVPGAANVYTSPEVPGAANVYTSSELAGPADVYTSSDVPGAPDVYTTPEPETAVTDVYTRATSTRTHLIDVLYDGPDLDDVAARAGLSREEVIALHAGREYDVEVVGFLPGFAYMGPLDARLVVPRRPAPRPRVPAQSVAIAGPFTGIYPLASPGGWSLLGRSLGPLPFDPSRARPFLFAPGDRVRFRPIAADPAPSEIEKGGTPRPLSSPSRVAHAPVSPRLPEAPAFSHATPAPEVPALAPERSVAPPPVPAAAIESSTVAPVVSAVAIEGSTVAPVVSAVAIEGSTVAPVVSAVAIEGSTVASVVSAVALEESTPATERSAPAPARSALLVVRPPGPVTVQDGGRRGLLGLGMPPSGPLDPALFSASNRAVGNAADDAALEILGGALVLRAVRDVAVSIDGAPAVHLGDGEELRVPEGAGAVRYVAVAGGIDVPVVVGARATLLSAKLGGLEGRILRRGDVLPIGEQRTRSTTTELANDVRALENKPLLIDPGPHVERFPPGALDVLLTAEWELSRLTDRTGARLTGAAIPREGHDLAGPVPMCRGVVQVTTDGTPIVLGPDHPTTGGYPVLAVVRASSFGALAQKRPGERVRFRLAGPELAPVNAGDRP